MKETWKDIAGYEGLYQVSNLGQVKSLDRTEQCKNGRIRRRKGCIKTLHTDKDGYNIITICKNNIRKTFHVYRLVYEAFNGPIPDGMQVNHIDECKTNDAVWNLNLMTPKENTNWGTCIKRRGTSQRNRPDTSKIVLQYSIDGEFIKQWESTKEIQRSLGFANPNISACCLGKKETAYGFVWRYAVNN